MSPLLVEFTFSMPVAFNNDDPIHLDSLLSYGLSREALHEDHPDPWGYAKQLDALLASQEYAGQRIWCASTLVFEPASLVQQSYMTRPCEPMAHLAAREQGVLDEKGRPRKVLNSFAGDTKAWFVPFSYQWMKTARAWCVGDAQHIEHVLDYVTHIGKYSRNNWGAIKTVSVRPDPQAQSRWRHRHLPLGMPGCEQTTYGIRHGQLMPPYWEKINAQAVQCPL